MARQHSGSGSSGGLRWGGRCVPARATLAGSGGDCPLGPPIAEQPGIRLGIDDVHASVLYRHKGVSLAVQIMMQQTAVSSLAGPEGVVLRIGADEMAYQAICRSDGMLLAEAVAVVDKLPVPPDGCRLVVIDCGGAVVPEGEPLPESSQLKISLFQKTFRTHSLPTLYAKSRLPHWTQGAVLAACLALVMGVFLVPFRAGEQTPLHPPLRRHRHWLVNQRRRTL